MMTTNMDLMSQCFNGEPSEQELNNREPVQGREGIDCHLCNNYEYTWTIKDGKRCIRDCICKQKRDSYARIRKSGLMGEINRCTFESYQTLEPWQEKAKQTAIDFTQNGKWLLFSGTPGSGKTHLCTAIAGEFLEKGLDVRYMSWVDEATKLKALVNMPEEYDKFLHDLKNCKVLYIDDFFKVQKGAQPTPADVRLAFSILNYRMRNVELITMISTEWTITQLIDIDEALGSRIYEISKDYILTFSGDKNWRLKHDTH